MSGNLLVFFTICILATLTFLPSFSLGLYGDDWMSLYRSNNIPPQYMDYGDFAYLHYFFDNYGAQEFIMNSIFHFVGTNGFYFFLISFFLRLFAALTLIPLVFIFTKDKLASFSSAIFFVVTAIGIESTSWVFNMPSYLSLGCFNLFWVSYIKAKEESFKYLLPAFFFFIFTYSFAPIRMTGFVPFIVLIECIWFLLSRSKISLQMGASRFGVVLLAFSLISLMGASFYQQKFLERLISGANTTDGGVIQAIDFLKEGDVSFAFTPVTTLGSMIIPDYLLKESWSYSKSNLFVLILGVWGVFLLISKYYFSNVSRLENKFFYKYILFSTIPVLIPIIAYLNNKLVYSNLKFVFFLEIGGIFIFFIATLVYLSLKRSNQLFGLLFGLFWTFLGFILAWWTLLVAPIFTTAHRYLLPSAVGISVLLAMIINLVDKKFQKRVVTIIGLLILLHALATQNYLLKENTYRGEELSKRIWSTMPPQPQISDRGQREIFYIYGEDSNSSVLGNIVSFGGGYHFALLNELNLQNDLVPMVVDSYPLLIEQFKNGSIKSIEDVYSYKLVKNQKFVETTSIIREKLSNEKF